MSLLVMLLAAVVALAYLLLPGWMVAWGLGIQGALRLVSSPALSLGIWAGATWIATGLQLPWCWWSAMLLTVLIVVPFVLGRLFALRTRIPWPLTPHTSVSSRVWVVSVLGSLVCAAPFVVGTDFGSRPPQTWDAVFHLSAIRYTRVAGSASPWESLSQLFNGRPTYYPNVFHNIAALLPGSTLSSYSGFLLAILLLWPPVMALFTLLALARLQGVAAAQGAAALAAVGSSMGSNFPANQVANLATPPYLLSVLAMPGLLMLAVFIYRLRPSLVSSCGIGEGSAYTRQGLSRPKFYWRDGLDKVLYSSQLAPWLILGWIVGVAGLVSTHPTALFNLLLMLGVPVTVLLGRCLHQWGVSTVFKIVLVSGVTVALGVLFRIVLWPRLSSMSKFVNPENKLVQNLWRLAVDYPKGAFGWGFGVGGAVFTAAALYAVTVLIRRRRVSWLVAAFMTSLVWFIFAAGTVWPFYYLTTPWYLQYSRLAPLVLICVYALGSYGIQLVWLRLSSLPYLVVNPKRSRILAAGCLLALVAATCGGTVPGRYEVVRSAYDPAVVVRGTMLSDPEREFMKRVSDRIPADAVIWGAAYQGTPYWWILYGKEVLMPALTWPDAKVVQIMRELYGEQHLSVQSCEYLQSRGVTHYYADTDKKADGARYGHFKWLWERRDVSFVLPKSMLKTVAVNRLSAPDEGFRGQIMYELNYETCG